MRRYIVIILTLLLPLVMVACGNDTKHEESSSTVQNVETLHTNSVSEPDTEPKQEQEPQVGSMEEETRKGGLPCTACHYCTSHCPKGLPIPELIALYNEHKVTGGGFIAPMAVSSMPQEKRPSNCIGCKGCEQVCLQQIKISGMMKDFTSMIRM